MSAVQRRSQPHRHFGVRQSATALLVAALAACSRDPGPAASIAESPPMSAERLLVQAGELEAGVPKEHGVARNPLDEDPNAAADGERLYLWMNCAGCHGVKGGGGIGPPLRDVEWIYGNDPASLFQSVAQGRPNGMPAFGAKLPDEQIWRIVAYVKTLDPSKELVRHGGSSGQSPTEAQKQSGSQ